MKVAPARPDGVRTVAEQPDGEGLHTHADWSAALPWLVQGVTGRDADMSLFGNAPTGDVIPRWLRVRDRLRCRTIVHARQIHRDTVLLHEAVPAGLVIGPDADGHITRQVGTLLAVSVADCVPIFIAAPRARAVALLHGGWRGVAAGILERGLALLTGSFPDEAADLYVHFGPAICGECFEVGPEVPEGLGMASDGQYPADGHGRISHVDLRALLAHRAISAGVVPDRITVSEFCTRHDPSPFYSHRGGCAERQIGVLGVRAV
jgi:YfiH family protein